MSQTTHRSHRGRADMAALKSDGNGDITFKDVVLKQSATPYESGQLLVLEYTESVADSGNFNTKGSKYIALVGSDWTEFAGKEVAVNLYATDATQGDVPVAVAVRLAEIVAKNTDLSELSAPDQAAFIAEAAKSFMIVA